MDLATDIR